MSYTYWFTTVYIGEKNSLPSCVCTLLQYIGHVVTFIVEKVNLRVTSGDEQWGADCYSCLRMALESSSHTCNMHTYAHTHKHTYTCTFSLTHTHTHTVWWYKCIQNMHALKAEHFTVFKLTAFSYGCASAMGCWSWVLLFNGTTPIDYLYSFPTTSHCRILHASVKGIEGRVDHRPSSGNLWYSQLVLFTQ